MAWLAAASVLAICLLMILQGIGRQLGVPTGGTNDAVAWLCAASAFLAMPHSFKHGDFVRVTLVFDKVSPDVQRLMELVSLAIASIAIGYLTWWATRFAYESWQFNEMSSGMLAIPIWIPQSAFVAGAWGLLLAVLDEFLLVAGGKRPTYVLAVEERHAQGDFSSDI